LLRRLAWLPLLALPLGSCSHPVAPAEAYVIDHRDQRIGGPASRADLGDLVLENGHLRVGILSSRCDNPDDSWGHKCSSPGPGLFGGSMVDIDLQRGDGRDTGGNGEDRFAELFGSLNLEITAVSKTSIIADGSEGPAIVRSEGPAGNYISYISLLGNLLDLPKTWHATDFILNPGDKYLTVRTHALVTDAETYADIDPPEGPICGWDGPGNGLPCDDFLVPPVQGQMPLLDNFNRGISQLGDFFFPGGDLDIFVPGMGFDEGLQVVAAFEEGRNSFTDPFAMPYVAATGDGVSYAFGNGGWLNAPLFASSLTAVFGAEVTPELDAAGDVVPPAPGTLWSYERWMAVGQGDVGSALDILYEAYEANGIDMNLGTLEGRLLEARSLDAVSGVSVLVYRNTGAARDSDGLPPREDLFTQYESDVGQDAVPDGSFGGRLPAGDYVLVAKEQDRALSEVQEITITQGETTRLSLVTPEPGALDVIVVDAAGLPIPCKVSLRRRDAPGARYDLGDPFLAGGSGRLGVPDGTYDVFVSRGPEYGLWDSREHGFTAGVKLAPGQITRVEAVIAREVDSTGYVSADLHVHAFASHDSGVSLAMRALTMAAEGVEFFAGTDHDVITDYRPVIDELGLNRWVQSTAGLETTTIEVGHFLGFPFVIDYDQPTHNGSLDWTGLVPDDIVDGMRELAAYGAEDSFVFVGHPRDGILGYFDQYGWTPYAGGLRRPEFDFNLINLANPILEDTDNFSLDFDGIELLNGKRFDFIRTPTKLEMDCFAAQAGDGTRLPGCDGLEHTAYSFTERTMAEQDALANLDEPFYLSRELDGQVDDWFMLMNLGYRHTALGNSDTHDLTGTESGCPRNYVVSETDDPEQIDDLTLARAVKAGKVVTSYGPLIKFTTADGAATIGDTVEASSGTVTLHIEVQAPRWMRVDRVELYENGRLIREFTDLDNAGVVKFKQNVEVTPLDEDGEPIDAFYVVIVNGEQDLSPLYTPVEVPNVELNDVVVGALGELDLGPLASAVSAAAPFPKTHPVYPFALTNPIWVDVDGDTNGDGNAFEAMGRIPSWMRGDPE
jgi:hypothetical protein